MADFNIKRGINFQPYREWKRGYDVAQDKYLKKVKEAGFDHIRCPFYINVESDRKILEFEKMEDIVNLVLENGLVPIIDVHGFGELNSKTAELKGAFIAMWDALAEHFKDIDQSVIFEIFNEPSGVLDNPDELNSLQFEVIKAIRRTNKTRIILAAVPHMNVIENLQYIKLPDDENIMVTIHEYTPMSFTHQGAWWDPNFKDLKNVSWGSEEDYRLLEARLDMAAEWAEKNNRKLHMGEFGAYSTAVMADRAAWTRHIVKLMNERNIAWSYWEFAYGYAVYDTEKDEWIEPLKKALLQEN